MTTLIHKLLKNESSLRIIATLKPLPRCTPFLLTHNETVPKLNVEDNRVPLFNPVISQTSESGQVLRHYPSFPFGYYGLNHACSTGLFDPASVDVVGSEDVVSEDDSGTLYADSVKKKRKKKMNKHKYKKLRKRLRRKT